MKSTPALTVTCGTEADLATLFDMERACFPTESWAESALLSHLKSPVCGALVATIENVPCAYLLWQAIPPEFELLRVGTLPAFRGGGAARTLVQALFRHMKSIGADRGFLEVRAANTVARRLYEACGYVPCGERKNYYQAPTEHAALYEISLKDDIENV